MTLGRLAALGLMFVAACGGETAPTPPPPPPPPPTPATVAVNAGDGQEAEPGKAVSASPSVVVRTAGGAAVPNVLVTFAVDSGGGTIAVTSATTDAAGIASAGAWTLGPAEGPQTLSATAGALPKVTIRATARFAPTTVPTGGGTVTINRPTSPLNGIKITVPTGAYPTATEWSVSEVPDLHPPLPAKVRQIGPVIRLSNGQGFAAKPFTITLPVRLPSDSAVAAFFRDPSSGKLELIPILARTDTSLVLLTQHVSADQMLLPQSAAPAPAAALMAGLPSIEIITVGARVVDLNVRIGTSFQPGVDDWEFANRGSALTPGGYCTGATLTALYHNYVRKGRKGPLFGLYDKVDAIGDDNPLGIRLASVVQKTMNYDGQSTVRKALEGTRDQPSWIAQMLSLPLAMLLTDQAQQLVIFQPLFSGAHALIAHGFQWGRLFVTDPNTPGVERTIDFTTSGVEPFRFAQRAGAAEEEYVYVVPLAASALMPARQLDALFAELEAGAVGGSHFPAAVTEYRDPADTVWRRAKDAIVTASDHLTFRTICKTCPQRGEGAKEPRRGWTIAFDGAGAKLGDDYDDLVDGVDVAVNRGKNASGLTSHISIPSSNNWHYADFGWHEIERVQFELSTDPVRPVEGDRVTFTVTNGGIGTSGMKYRWTIGNEPPEITSFSERTLTRTIGDPGSLVVTVELMETETVRLAKARLSLGPSPYWRITTFADQDELIEMAESAPLADLLQRIVNVPQSALIAIEDEPSGGTALRLRVLPSGTWSLANCCPPASAQLPGEMRYFLGAMPEQQFAIGPFFAGFGTTRWSQTTQDLGAGTVTSQFVDGLTTYSIEDLGSQVGPRSVMRVNATRNGTAMTGTITITSWYFDFDTGIVDKDDPPAVFRFPFTAVRVK